MQGFIEVKTLTDDSAILLPIVHITAVVERDYGTFIETGVDGKGRTIGIRKMASRLFCLTLPKKAKKRRLN